MKTLLLGLFMANVFASSWFLIPSSGPPFTNPSSVELAGNAWLKLGSSDLHTNAATARTFVIWVKVVSFANYNIYWSDQQVRGLGMGINTGNGKVFWDMYDGGVGELQITGDNPISASTWTMVTESYDASSTPAGVKIWLGNTLQPQTTVVNVPFVLSTTSAVPVAMGSIGNLGSSFWVSGGRMNMAASYSRAFVQADVDAIYGTGHAVDLSTLSSYSSIEAWWRMGNCAGDSTSTIKNCANPGTFDATGTNISIVTDSP